MGDRLTEPLKPYEPDPDASYEYDYGYDDPPLKPRVLWGRVAILGIGLLLAFLIGRALAPAGASQEQIDDLKAQVAELQDENESLREQLTEQPTTQPSGAATPTTAATDTTAEGETYVVARGDTLRLIAQRLCGDPEVADAIMELNGITDATQLSVGDSLTLPSGCSAD